MVLSETFIRAHAELLPGNVTIIEGMPPEVGNRPVLSKALPNRAFRKVWRLLLWRGWEWEITASYSRAFRSSHASAVLAEYGPSGVAVVEACRRVGVPLIVHFHGYDASVYSILQKHAEAYRTLFREAKAIIAVSRAMQRKLISLGAPAGKVHYNPYGVDCKAFDGSNPAAAPPLFLAVGRFVEKKAPHLTLLAFAEVHRVCPNARLRMIGDGPLWGACRDLARGLQIDHAVTFLGAQPHSIVQEEMRRARAFVQHSVEASCGDCEGTPVGILEAGASGLPVVSTRHAGIPDVIVEGQTGLLVDERDVKGMAAHMLQLIHEPAIAERLGRAARQRIETRFSIEHSIGRLWSIIESCIASRNNSRSMTPPTGGTRPSEAATVEATAG